MEIRNFASEILTKNNRFVTEGHLDLRLALCSFCLEASVSANEAEFLQKLLENLPGPAETLDVIGEQCCLKIDQKALSQLLGKLTLHFFSRLLEMLFLPFLPFQPCSLPRICDMAPEIKRIAAYMGQLRLQNQENALGDDVTALVSESCRELRNLDFAQPLPVFELQQTQKLFQTIFAFLQKKLFKSSQLEAESPQEAQKQLLIKSFDNAPLQTAPNSISELKKTIVFQRKSLTQSAIAARITEIQQPLLKITQNSQLLNTLQFSSVDLEQFTQISALFSKIGKISRQIQRPARTHSKMVCFYHSFVSQITQELVSSAETTFATAQSIEEAFHTVFQSVEQASKLVTLVLQIEKFQIVLAETHTDVFAAAKHELLQILRENFYELRSCADDYRGQWGLF